MRSIGGIKIVPVFLAALMILSSWPISSQAADAAVVGKQELSEKETRGIVLMREEEKLARDLYLSLGEKWNIRTFFNIAESEGKHMDEMGRLISEYGLEDPVGDNARGVFTSAEMGRLHDELLERGSRSVLDALTVGAEVEDLDIADLESLLAETDKEDIRIVYLNLAKGSRNHLRTFSMQIEKRGGTYKASHITERMYNSITGSPKEQGEITDPAFEFAY